MAGERDAEVEEVAVAFSEFSTRARMVLRGEQRGEDVDIAGAEVLVAGGRGLGKDIQTTMRYADYAPSAREAELISAAFDQTAIELHGGETEALFRPHT